MIVQCEWSPSSLFQKCPTSSSYGNLVINRMPPKWSGDGKVEMCLWQRADVFRRGDHTINESVSGFVMFRITDWSQDCGWERQFRSRYRMNGDTGSVINGTRHPKWAMHWVSVLITIHFMTTFDHYSWAQILCQFTCHSHSRHWSIVLLWCSIQSVLLRKETKDNFCLSLWIDSYQHHWVRMKIRVCDDLD